MNGQTEKVEGIADTVDEAFAKAQSKLPDNVDVLEKNVIASPRTTVIVVGATDEATARTEARDQMWSEYSPKSTRIKGVKFKNEGKKERVFRNWQKARPV